MPILAFVYRGALKIPTPERGELFRQQANLKLLVFDKQTEEILKWIP